MPSGTSSKAMVLHAGASVRRRYGVPKICGSDVELGNFVSGANGATSHDAARMLLREIPGHARRFAEHDWHAANSWSGYRYGTTLLGTSEAVPLMAPVGNAEGLTDWGRKFLPGNGGSVYIDLGHLELATPECRSARDHVAWSRAMLLIARRAAERANAGRGDDGRLTVLANNSDGLGASYGSHVSFLVSSDCFDNIMNFKPLHMQLLASVQAALILFSGAGKVGSENGNSTAEFQISARSDFIESLHGSQTTYRRPLINTRDEALCGLAERAKGADAGVRTDLARIHCISMDHVLCPMAGFLRVGVMQLVLAMLERDTAPVALVLEDPVSAIDHWSRDPDLETRMATIDGRLVTAPEYMRALHAEAAKFCAGGFAAGIVPDADDILAAWIESVDRFARLDWVWLARRFDWCAKRLLVRDAAARVRGWRHEQMKYLDHQWSNLDPRVGVYWRLEAQDMIERVVDEPLITRALDEAPGDTRAWLRSWALRRCPGAIEDLDWDTLWLRVARREWWDTSSARLSMPDPGMGQHECAPILERFTESPAEGLRELLSRGGS